jgi:hypothetical protein
MLIVKHVVEMEYVKHVLKINIKESIVKNPAVIVLVVYVPQMVLALIQVLIVKVRL